MFVNSKVLIWAGLGCSLLAAQVPDLATPTKLDAFQYRSGAVITVDTFHIGNLVATGARVELEAVVAAEPTVHGNKAKGARIKLTDFKKKELPIRIASMDEDEVIAIGRALGKISDLAVDAIVRESSQIAIRTRSDILLGVLKGSRRSTAFVAIGAPGTMADPNSADTFTVTFDAHDLMELRSLFEKTAELLAKY